MTEVKAEVPTEQRPGEPDVEWTAVWELVNSAPQAAVILAFTLVEQAVREVAVKKGLAGADRLGARQLTRAADLPAIIEEAVAQLSALRNEVAHLNAKPTEATAQDYVIAAARLYEYLKEMSGAIPAEP